MKTETNLLIDYLSNRGFYRVYIASSKHEEGWTNISRCGFA